jgi:thymidylate synthase (FAD)
MGNKTGRVIVQGIEDLLGVSIPVLDKGFIKVIDYMGGDSSIESAARVSNGNFESSKKKTNLISYLLRNGHTSPFEMCELKLHIKMPIFVCRQWIRHRTASVNEISGRYTTFKPDFYIPKHKNINPQSQSNKQGRSEESYSDEESEEMVRVFEEASDRAFDTYYYLCEDKGVAKELARTILPLNTYTEIYWKIDLHNLLNFLKQRTHPHAQYEIREYAKAILDIVEKWCPETFEVFKDLESCVD